MFGAQVLLSVYFILLYNIIQSRLAHLLFLPVCSYRVPIVVDMILGLTWEVLGRCYAFGSRKISNEFDARLAYRNRGEWPERIPNATRREKFLFAYSYLCDCCLLGTFALESKRKCVFLLYSARLFVPLHAEKNSI